MQEPNGSVWDDRSMRTVRVRISGRVQGVFFRASCARLARDLGISGWIRNRPEGDLEAVFQGPDPAVGDMLTWCRHGPPAARVEGIEIRAEQPLRDTGFRVEH
jgi:acylphosphatase